MVGGGREEGWEGGGEGGGRRERRRRGGVKRVGVESERGEEGKGPYAEKCTCMFQYLSVPFDLVFLSLFFLILSFFLPLIYFPLSSPSLEGLYIHYQ